MRNEQFVRTRGVTLQLAKASLASELPQDAANDTGYRVAALKQQMAEWRRRKEGRDFGRKM